MGIDEELASQGLGSPTRRTSREDSPPAEVSRERLAQVGEPSAQQVDNWMVAEAMRRAEEEAEDSGGVTDYSANSGKSR